jgi:peptidoglycan-associated lipoprotein
LVLEINFDYDRSNLKPEALAMLDVFWSCLSKELAGKNNWVLAIGGYTDEWGNRAYNIALGERRSRSVMQYFSSKGVAANQLQIVTYGESVPATPLHAPDAWAKNRRAVVTVQFR